MTTPVELHVVTVPQEDPRLGRQCLHDPRSRQYAAPRRTTTAKRRDKTHRIYDPRPNPNQPRGNCTGCAEAMMGNAAGNRIKGVTLGMDTADRIYSRATELDPWPGSWPPTDTGSSGTAAAKAAVEQGVGTGYEWYFGIDAVLDGLQRHALSAGTWWTEGLFHPDKSGLIRPTGRRVGGHQYLLRGHDVSVSRLSIGKQRIKIRCWWGAYRDAEILVDDLAALLADDGDVHRTIRAVSAA